MKPSEVLRAYVTGRRAAKALGQELVLDERKIERHGFAQFQIDAIFDAAEKADELDRQFNVLCAHVDAVMGRDGAGHE